MNQFSIIPYSNQRLLTSCKYFIGIVNNCIILYSISKEKSKNGSTIRLLIKFIYRFFKPIPNPTNAATKAR